MMNEDKNIPNSSFDDAIKNKLYNYEIEPNASLWANIEEAIQTDTPTPKKKDNSKYFLLLLACISLIGISATSSYYILHNQAANKENKNRSINSNQFAMNYNQVNYPSNNQNISATSNSTTSKNQSDKFIVNHVFVSNDHTKHIYLTTIPQSQLELATIATENRISNYKEIPPMYLASLNNTNTPLAFNNKREEEEPIFNTNRPNIKGLYLGGTLQTSINSVTNNNTQNKMFGSAIKYAPGMSYKAGLLVGYNLSNKVGMQSGINYIYKNMSYTSRLYDAVNKGKLNLSYMEIPLIVKYKSNWVGPKNKVNAVNVYTGMSYSYLVRAEAKMDNQKFSHYNKNYNAKEFIPNHQLNFIAGIEYQIYVRKNLALSFGAEANYGGSANEITDWTRKNTTAFTNVGVGVNTTITFSTKKVIK